MPHSSARSTIRKRGRIIVRKTRDRGSVDRRSAHSRVGSRSCRSRNRNSASCRSSRRSQAQVSAGRTRCTAAWQRGHKVTRLPGSSLPRSRSTWWTCNRCRLPPVPLLDRLAQGLPFDRIGRGPFRPRSLERLTCRRQQARLQVRRRRNSLGASAAWRMSSFPHTAHRRGSGSVPLAIGRPPRSGRSVRARGAGAGMKPRAAVRHPASPGHPVDPSG